MAIYHLSAQIIGRNQGKSAVAAAAYRAGVELHSEYQDVVFDYSRKKGVVFSEIQLPEQAPEWMGERKKLWNAVETFETRKDATYSREIEAALPLELSLDQQKELVREFVKENFVKVGMIADYSIHDVNSNNPHVHIMLTLRPIENGSFGKKERSWNDKKLLVDWREQWAAISNKHLALAGVDKKISHLSYADQGVDLEPTMHRGYMSRGNMEILDRFQKAKTIQIQNYNRLINNPNIALDLLTNHESVFSHQDLARFVNERTQGIEEFNNLKIAIESSKEIVRLGQGLDGKDYYTSKKVLQQEQDLIDRALRMSKSNIHQLDPKKFKFVLASRTLYEEQKTAFEHILSGNDLSLVVGFAGTGKSYLMDAVREAYEAQGYNVVGTALSGRAADGLKTSAHIESRTIARFLIDWENGRQQLTNKTVLIIDEIGMVGTRQMQRLLSEAERVGAKVIGCGDPEQIPPVEAGCPFRFLLERIKPVFLKNVIRQNEEWQRQATVELSTRRHSRAIDRYKDMGFVHSHETKDVALTQLVDRWFSYSQTNPEKSAVMMAYRNVEVLAMNLMARERLLSGEILEKERISSIKTEKYGELEFAIGERIMFLRNENSINVKNGNLGKIENMIGSVLTVKMDRGDILTFDTRDYNDFGYGYAATFHKLQGGTVDQSFVLATPHMDRFLTNVAMNRHRENLELHYGKDDFATYDNLKRTLARGESKVLAVEFAQARGIDYDLRLDEATHVESQKDFSNYYNEVLSESLPIKNTLAERYLNIEGIEDVNISSLRYHPGIWERETQTYMPALIAKAVGQGEKGLETKGVQVTFLDENGNKAALDHPVRYSGSSNAIIMLQKPVKTDSRWYVTADIETALAISKANSEIRVACLATQEQFDKNPLQGEGKKQIIFCANQLTPQQVIDKAVDVFNNKGFEIFISKPDQEKTFSALLNTKGSKAVQAQLDKSTQKNMFRSNNILVHEQPEIEL